MNNWTFTLLDYFLRDLSYQSKSQKSTSIPDVVSPPPAIVIPNNPGEVKKSDIISSLPNPPTLIYPNGNENILTRVLQVSWKEPAIPSPDKSAAWYEVLYTEDFSSSNEPDWITIASSVPVGSNKFLWTVGNSIKNANIRVGVRTVNIRGERSDISYSANSFLIKRSEPSPPAILSPVSGHRYGSSIDIVFDDSIVINSYNQRSKYYAYVRSVKAKIPYTTVAQEVSIGSGPIVWNTSLLPSSDDYELIAFISDDDGNKSSEIVVSNISIFNEGYFIVDTKPPSGFLQINSGDEFTRSKDVSVRLFAFDDVTGINAIKFMEEFSKDDGSVSLIEGSPESYVNLKYWKLSDGDGEKNLQVLFQDYGGNRTENLFRNFRIKFSANSDEIADIIFQGNPIQNVIWIAVNSDISGTVYNFSPASSKVAEIDSQIISLSIFNDVLYFSAETIDDTCLVYRYVGLSAVERVIRLSDFESRINSLQSYKEKLYLGALNGTLYSYNGSVINAEKKFTWPIDRLYSDGSLLFIMFRGNSSVFTFDGNLFTEIKL